MRTSSSLHVYISHVLDLPTPAPCRKRRRSAPCRAKDDEFNQDLAFARKRSRHSGVAHRDRPPRWPHRPRCVLVEAARPKLGTVSPQSHDCSWAELIKPCVFEV
jgi:hypothetical protein